MKDLVKEVNSRMGDIKIFDYVIINIAEPFQVSKSDTKRRPKNLLQEDDENFVVEGRPDLAGTIGFVTGYNEHTLVFLIQVVGTKEELEVHEDQITKHPLSDGETVFVPFNVPSSKNSKVATGKGVFHSKTVSRYLQKIGISYFSSSKRIFEKYKLKPCYFPLNLLQESFKDVKHPIEVGFHFVRDSFRDFDFQNVIQLPLDIMTAAKIIPDDNMNFIVPRCLKQNNKFYTVSKRQAGVWIKPIKENNNGNFKETTEA